MEKLSVKPPKTLEELSADIVTVKQPLVSVVIATYKQHTSLPIAVRSALNQTYPNVEVVVVPVLTDIPTVRALKQFREHPKVKVVPSVKANYVCQRNLGVSEAEGKWITMLDSDDYMLPGKVKADLMVAVKEKAYVVYSPLLQADSYFRVGSVINTEPFSYERLVKNCFITDSSLFLKALWAELGGFNSKWRECAFYDFWLRIAERYPDRIKLNPFPGVVYVQHPAQMHRTIDQAKHAWRRKAVAQQSLKRMRK